MAQDPHGKRDDHDRRDDDHFQDLERLEPSGHFAPGLKGG